MASLPCNKSTAQADISRETSDSNVKSSLVVMASPSAGRGGKKKEETSGNITTNARRPHPSGDGESTPAKSLSNLGDNLNNNNPVSTSSSRPPPPHHHPSNAGGSDVSSSEEGSRTSKAGTSLEKFFTQMGMEPNLLDINSDLQARVHQRQIRDLARLNSQRDTVAKFHSEITPALKSGANPETIVTSELDTPATPNFSDKAVTFNSDRDPRMSLTSGYEAAVFQSLSSVDLSSDARSSCSAVSRSACSVVSRSEKEGVWDEDSLSENNCGQVKNSGSPLTAGAGERNARILNWLCNVKKAKEPPPGSS